MIWPTVCVDNFFSNPDEIVAYANKQKFEADNRSPGRRSPLIHTLDFKFFRWSCLKILKIFYPHHLDNLNWKAKATFQKVPPTLDLDGWIHTDSKEEVTAIIYLSKQCESGTSLYERRSLGKRIYEEKHKYDYFINPEVTGKARAVITKARKENNEGFKETVSFKGVYNRLVMFDGAQFHAAQVHNKGSEDRLTYVVGFENISIDKYPIPESNRI